MGFWLTLLLWVVTFVLSELLRPKPKIEQARAANLGDFSFPTATQGRIVPLVWGTVKLNGPNVVWYGDLEVIPIKEKVKTGLFSSEMIIRGYQYHVGVQMALCRGPLAKLSKIWVEDDLIYSTPGLTAEGTIVFDLPELFGGDKVGTGGISGTGRWHVGSETQAVSAYLAPFQQQGGDSPAYRGTSYFTLEHMYLGTSTSIVPWRFEVQRIPNGLALGTPGVNGGLDANPMNVIYELLTNTEWGFGFPATDIDVTNFQTAADTLRVEGNGFSFVLDNPMESSEFLKELERQIDGVVVLDRTTGKWKVTLARSGYDVNLIPQATSANIISVESYSRGAWDETSNEVRVNFSRRGAEHYIEDFASAQDGANIRVQNVVIPVQLNFPGVKVSALANSLAWRELRSASRPLGKATLVVDRTFFAVNPGDVIAWTDVPLGLDKLAMRVTKVDLGSLQEGKITMQLVEDIFNFKASSAGEPPESGWQPPSDTVLDIATADRVVFEAPKAFADRDPFSPGLYRRIWFGARHQADVAIQIELEVAGTVVGTVAGFLLAGKLLAALPPAAQGGNVTVVPDPDGLQRILNTIVAAGDLDIGVSLANIIMIDNEFLGFRTAINSSGNIQFQTVYRGMIDSAAAAHLINARVWLLYVNGNITEKAFTTSPISLKPIPIGLGGRLPSGSATASSVTIADRHLKPYPPANLLLNAVIYAATVSMDAAAGASDDGAGFDADYTRRDYRNGDEVLAVISEANLPSDFPTVHNTRYSIDVTDISSGTTLLFTTAFINGNNVPISRTQILRHTNGVIPTNLRLTIKTRHTINSVDHDALQNLVYDFAVTSALLAGDFNFTALDDNEVSAVYTAPETGTYAFSIGSNVLSSGAVQARINGGAFATVIATGNTTGNLAGVVASDTIEVRHTQGGANTNQTLLRVLPPTATPHAHGILII